jgi:RHS repeat-associated protein
MGCRRLTYQNFNFLEVVCSEKRVSEEKKYINPLQYIYQYKDHLGNVRLSYSDADGNGTISQSEIIEENNYYPMGLKHKGYNNNINGVEHKWKYNSKELQDELGLNWYDLGARNLDHALGRFMNIDPRAEEYNFQSPYAFANNNPILFIDINGEGVADIIIRARSEKSNGDYVAIAVIKTEIVATIDLDLDVASAPLIDGVTGAEKPIEINGNQIDPKADAIGISVTGSASIGYGEGKAKSVVAFVNGTDKGKVFEYNVDLKNAGLEASGTLAFDQYFAQGNVAKFNKNTLEGSEVGIDLSGGNVGVTGFAGVDLKNLRIPYVGYSKALTGGVGLPIKAYKSSSTLVKEYTTSTQKKK